MKAVVSHEPRQVSVEDLPGSGQGHGRRLSVRRPAPRRTSGTWRIDVTANQLHRQARYQGGKDERHKPYGLFRLAIDAGPVLLRP